MKKVGIFSGTFDPVHDGHIAFASEAIKRCDLDRVYLLPEPRPRRKQGVKAFEHRVNMLELALSSHPKLGTIILKQARFNVVETLPKLRARFKGAELYMLVGEDVLMHMINWPHLQDLVNSVQFIVGTRKRSPDDLAKHISVIEKTRGLKFNYTVFTAENSLTTSNSVRRQLRLGAHPEAVNKKVLAYINQHKLYSSAESLE